MKVGDTVFHVNGVDTNVKKSLLKRHDKHGFSIHRQAQGLDYYLHNWGEIFDNAVEADRAVLRNIDKKIEELKAEINRLSTDRNIVLKRLAP